MIENLPPTSDSEFWGDDGAKIQVNKHKPTPSANHYLVWKGPFAVCISCPFEHTIPLNRKVYDLKEGKPCKRT